MKDTEASIDSNYANAPLSDQLREFREFDTTTRLVETHARLFSGGIVRVPTILNEFWTAKQRQANSLHEVSYRACFKPQLPRFFIERLTQPGDIRAAKLPGAALTSSMPVLANRLLVRERTSNTLGRLFVRDLILIL